MTRENRKNEGGVRTTGVQVLQSIEKKNQENNAQCSKGVVNTPCQQKKTSRERKKKLTVTRLHEEPPGESNPPCIKERKPPVEYLRKTI